MIEEVEKNEKILAGTFHLLLYNWTRKYSSLGQRGAMNMLRLSAIL